VRGGGADHEVARGMANRSLCLLPTDVTGRQKSAMYGGARFKFSVLAEHVEPSVSGRRADTCRGDGVDQQNVNGV